MNNELKYAIILQIYNGVQRRGLVMSFDGISLILIGCALLGSCILLLNNKQKDKIRSAKKDSELYERNVVTLDSFLKLERDWNGYDGEKFDSNLILKCKKILDTLSYQPDIFPTARGSVQFEYELEDKSYLEFEIYMDKVTCLIVPNRDYDKKINFTIENDKMSEINRVLKHFYVKEYNLCKI